MRKVLVTSIGFNKFIDIGDPVSQARVYEAQAADELIFLDIDRASDNREDLVSILNRVSEEIFMPITVGGGIRTIHDFRNLLSNGADKVSINTAAVETPRLISDACEVFGAQCVVVSIDYKLETNGQYTVWTHGGTQSTGLHPVNWALECQRLGAGEILITSISRDGSRRGLDLELTRQIAEAVSIPVISSGGCGLTSHFIDGFIQGKADAIAAGTYFSFKDENPMQTRAQIKNSGVPIRMLT